MISGELPVRRRVERRYSYRTPGESLTRRRWNFRFEASEPTENPLAAESVHELNSSVNPPRFINTNVLNPSLTRSPFQQQSRRRRRLSRGQIVHLDHDAHFTAEQVEQDRGPLAAAQPFKQAEAG